jgi:hypothetical protein
MAAKATVSLPAGLRERLREPIDDLARWAQRVYRQKAAALSSPSDDSHTAQTNGSANDVRPNREAAATGIAETNTRQSSSMHEIRGALEDAAGQAGEEKSLVRIVDALKARSPEVALLLGW